MEKKRQYKRPPAEYDQLSVKFWQVRGGGLVTVKCAVLGQCDGPVRRSHRANMAIRYYQWKRERVRKERESD